MIVQSKAEGIQGGDSVAQQMQPAQQQSRFVDISQLTAAYQMGTVLREYKNTARATMVLGIVLSVLGGASMLLSIILFLYNGLLRGESYLLFLGLALLGYGISRIRSAGRNRGARVYLCTDGVMRVKAGEVEAIRWEQVTAVQKYFASVQGMYSLNRYILYQTGTMPLVLDKTFNGFEELGAEIERKVTKHLLPGAIAAYEAGHAVSFGPVSVTGQGLSVQAGQKTLPWEELGEVYVDNGFATLKKRRALMTWEKLSISQMLNLCVFLPLVKHIRETGEYKKPVSDQPLPNDNPQNLEWQGDYGQAAYPQLYGGDPVPLSYHPLPQPSYTSPSPQLAYAPAAAYPLSALSTAAPERRRGVALAGLVLGSASLLVFVSMFAVGASLSNAGALIALFWLGGLVSSSLGIVLSALGRQSKSRKTLATVGLVLSIIVLVLVLIFAVLVVLAAIQTPAP